jgi:hypothetical protein
MLILECSQGCYGRKDGRNEGRTDGSVTISLCNFVGEGIIIALEEIYSVVSKKYVFLAMSILTSLHSFSN